MARLALQQEARDDAHHLSARFEGGIGRPAPSGRPRRRHKPGLCLRRPKARPGRWATSRPAGSAPKRAPQKTQREEGAGFTFLTRTGTDVLFTDDPTSFGPRQRHGIISQRKVATPMGAGSRTVGRVMSRTVIWLVAGGRDRDRGRAWAWRGRADERAGRPRPGDQAATALAAPPSRAVHRRRARRPGRRPAAPAAPCAAGPTARAASPAPPPPWRCRPSTSPGSAPDGRAVIAGRANPGAKIVLLDGGKEIARAEADQRGEWVVIAQDPPLSAGQHELRVVQHIEGTRAGDVGAGGCGRRAGAPAACDACTRRQAAARGDAGDDRAAWWWPTTARAGAVGRRRAEVGRPRAVDLDYDDAGHVTVTGQATPGRRGARLSSTTIWWPRAPPARTVAGDCSRPTPIEPRQAHCCGSIGWPSDGKPVARLELPFDRVVVAPGTVGRRRLIVVRGDNLWNIAQRPLRRGLPSHGDLRGQQGTDPQSRPDLSWPSLQPAQGQLSPRQRENRLSCWRISWCRSSTTAGASSRSLPRDLPRGADRRGLAVLAAVRADPVVDLLLPRSLARRAAGRRAADRAGRRAGADGGRCRAAGRARTGRAAADPRLDLPGRLRRPHQPQPLRGHRRRRGLPAGQVPRAPPPTRRARTTSARRWR